MVLAFDGGVAAMAVDGGVATTAACNRCRRAAATERVVGVPRTPNRDATRTTLRQGLSSDDGGVAERRRRTGAIGKCGRRRRDKLQGWRGKCNAGLAGREGLYSRLISIGILGDFTESGDTSPSYLLFQTLLPLFWTLTCMI